MDGTLAQVLAALYEAHKTIDQLQQRIAELEAVLAAKQEQACPP